MLCYSFTAVKTKFQFLAKTFRTSLWAVKIIVVFVLNRIKDSHDISLALV